jgi:hypothetical protein
MELLRHLTKFTLSTKRCNKGDCDKSDEFLLKECYAFNPPLELNQNNNKVSESEEENENLELVASRVLRNLRKSEEALIKKFPFLSCPASEVVFANYLQMNHN